MREVARRLVANHDAAAVDAANPMLSSAAARSWTRDDHGSAWNDDDFGAVRAASAVGPAMKAETAAPGYLNDHAVRALVRCKRHGLHRSAR
jgi:hypothetical protein